MKVIDPGLLTSFLQLAGRRLEGDWVLVGGNVLPALGVALRGTYDIDLIALAEEQAGNSLPLMKLADEMGWPLETINQSAVVFLLKIPDFREHLIPLHQGEKATIYRPNVVLFTRLKLGRLSPADLLDCQAFIDLARTKADEPYDAPALKEMVDQAIDETAADDPRLRRLLQLAKHLMGD